MTVRILPFGDRALLAEVADLGAMLSLHGRLAASRPAGVVDLVPAARTVLVAVDPAVLSLAAARAWIGDAAGAGGADVMGDAVGAGADPTGPLVELPIVYDGADLAETAGLVGLGTAELAARHAAAEWSVAFTGFAPGFGYLVSADWPFPVPRLDRPRSRVPAGAVGLAGPFTGAYPRSSPGGWRLIGTTSAVLFDPAAATPALLQPGTRVRFRPAPALPASAP
uniref:5-oxoprolinase subunit B family protein n=2 Tax=Microbacteriaceae TaxID=85023 RepID=UPI0028F0D069